MNHHSLTPLLITRRNSWLPGFLWFLFQFLLFIGFVSQAQNKSQITSKSKITEVSSKPILNDSVFVNLDKSPKTRLGRLISYRLMGNRLDIQSQTGNLEITPFSPSILKITVTTKRPTIGLHSFSVVGKSDAKVPVHIQNFTDSLVYQTAEIKLCVLKKNSEIHYYVGGKAVLRERGGFFSQEKNQGFDFHLAKDEALYGLGGRALEINHVGRVFYNYNRASYGYGAGVDPVNICIPNLISTQGYGIYFDNYSPSSMDLGKSDPRSWTYSCETGGVNYFFYTGRNQAALMDRYTEITGRQPLPPRWALGFIQSRFGYKSDTETVKMVDRLKSENFPLDGMVLDLFWFGGTSSMGNLDWDKKHFPNPVSFIQTLKDRGVHLIVITEPYFTKTSSHYPFLSQHQLFTKDSSGRSYLIDPFWAGAASLLDIFKPEAQNWMWDYYKSRKDEGVSGFWCDLGEPENHPFGMIHELGPARLVHNVYGLVWSQFLYDKFRLNYPQERFFNLARTGYAGMQRYSVFPWSGDISRSYYGLKPQISMMIGMGLSGVGYMHSDLGGFTGPKDPVLYARWLEMGAFCPIMRAHGAGVPPEPVEYPDSIKNAVRKYVQLRYQLIPYNYTLAWMNAQNGSPLVRSVGFEDSKNPKLNNLNDEYLWGDNFLVAPIIQRNEKFRNVVLPSGKWIGYWDHKVYTDSASVSAPLDVLPLFVKAGAFIPMAPNRTNLSSYQADSLIVHYYADLSVPESSYTLYNDDGETFGSNIQGAFETFKFQGSLQKETMKITVSKNGGNSFNGQKSRHDLVFEIPRISASPQGVKIGSRAVPLYLSESDFNSQEFGSFWSAKEQVLKIHFKWDKITTQIKVAGIKFAQD